MPLRKDTATADFNADPQRIANADRREANSSIPEWFGAGPDGELREDVVGLGSYGIYLNVGSQRFDGDIFRPLRVREKDSIYRGIAIRFVGVPERSLQTLRAELERLLGRERRTLTCSHSACMLIARAANLRIADHADLRPMLPSHILPSRTIRKLIERGVLDHTGRRVEAQIYKAEDKSLEEILHEMTRGERKIMRDHVDGATAGATRWVRERISNWRR